MKKFFFLFIGLIISSTAITQQCLIDGIIFSDQNQIDSFQINYPYCTEIIGNVQISGEDITNLNGLNVLTSIGGYLSISQNSNLTNLTGLTNISSVGSLVLSQNQALSSLSGLGALTDILEHLAISNNDNLSNLTGLDNLNTIGGNLEITLNDSLNNFTGLFSLTSIGGILALSSNSQLENMIGLESLTSVGGLTINGNNSFQNFNGLENLVTLGGDLSILYNNKLTSLSGLDNIDASTIQNLHIINNDSLITCEVNSVCDYLSSPNGSKEIHFNAPGCNSQQEIEAACGVGLGESSMAESNIKIYPNPSSLSITIVVKEPINNIMLSIFNLNKQELIKQQINVLTTVIDISYLPSGVYSLRFTSEDEVRMFKVVKY